MAFRSRLRRLLHGSTSQQGAGGGMNIPLPAAQSF